MQPVHRRELLSLGLTLLGATLLGVIFSRPLLVPLLVIAVYFIINLRQLIRLNKWLLNKEKHELPVARGIWGEVFSRIYQLNQDFAKNRKHLSDVLTRFQAAVSAFPDGMLILNADNNIEWSNTAASELLGILHPRDSGQRISNLIREPRFVKYLNTGIFETSLEIKSQIRIDNTLSLQIIPFGKSDKLLILRDITSVLGLEEMRRNFISNASHELRTPITVLLGYLETFSDPGDISKMEQNKAIKNMYEQAQRMERLVADLLSLSKLETHVLPVHKQQVIISALLASLKENAEVLAKKKKITITLTSDDTITLIGDREELSSLFSNLINNAVLYTKENGKVDIKWQKNSPGGSIFSVTDTGIGIAPQHIPRLTERFYRVDIGRSRDSGGTGLGLAIVKHVLTRHDGNLAIESKMGKGSIFSCTFPRERTVST